MSSIGAETPLTYAHNLIATIELVKTICAEVIETCVREYSGVRAIVLTGSTARGEGTFRCDAGALRVLGDAEFLLVFDDSGELPSCEEMSALSGRIQNALAQCHGITCSIDLSPAYVGYFRKMQPHIFGYEVRECGRVVWGNTAVLDEIPSFQASEIPLEDGWRLLCNRIIEQLDPRLEADPDRLRYQTVKLYLDMATSLLLFTGRYAPTYRDRAENLRALASGADSNWPFPLYEFAELVSEATEWKTRLPQDALSELRIFQQPAIPFATQLWRWELQRLTGMANGASAGSLMRCRMKQQLVTQRWRGWVHVLRAEGWFRSWRNWPHWALLAMRGSPRYWIYAACAELITGGSNAFRYLPVAGRNPKIVSELVFNYKRFITGTTA